MENGTMLQFFHWYTPNDGNFWKHLKIEAKRLSEMGINAVWLPPACKANAGSCSVGYDVYDLYDLGEFDQKGTVRTKYGTKQELIEAVEECHRYKINVYVDIVLNHLAGADERENVTIIKVNENNRLEAISEAYETEAFTKFNYTGRNNKYSNFVWDKNSFTGIDFDAKNEETGIYTIQNEHGEGWEDMIADELGNYDYLMYNDIEFRNKAVREELKKWGKWYFETLKFEGVRLDAVKHIPPQFYNEWLDFMRANTNENLFAVGEYWAPGNVELLLKYIEATEGKMSLFDSALHHNLHNASKAGNSFDMTTIFDNTLTKIKPELSVTVVENHDTQPLQALEEPVEPWFKPIAYSLILLRQEGYPCIFYTDLYGASYTDKGSDGNDYEIFMPQCNKIFELIDARRKYAYGKQKDYFDHANCIGWIREGNEEHPNSGCAVVLSNGDAGIKKMEIGKKFAGCTFIDYLQNANAEIIIDENGFGEFTCNPGSISCWVKK